MLCLKTRTQELGKLILRKKSVKLVIFVFNRITELQNHVSLVEQFDHALITFSQWSENTLSNLHSASQVNINNLQASVAQVKVRS